MKKVVAIVLLFSFLFVSAILYRLKTTPVRNFYQASISCPFCDTRMIENQQVYTGKWVSGLLNYKPLSEGHTLLVPRRHVSRLEDLTPEEWLEMQEVSQKFQKAFKELYGKEDYILIIQNGPNGGQTVPHLHFHMIPRGGESTLWMKV